jgi:uncharacterized integral membrane protein
MAPWDNRRCAHCGTFFPAGAAFCGHCGARNEQGATALDVVATIVLILLCLIVAAAGACFLVFAPFTGVGLPIGLGLLWGAFLIGRAAVRVATKRTAMREESAHGGAGP